MTQQDRQKQSRQKILNAALIEFGAHDYDLVTMDSICARHTISKGMMYHYYSGKDELFLHCLQVVFDALLCNMEVRWDTLLSQPPQQALHDFFLLREEYFQQYPEQKNIFENALLRTPPQLEARIYAMRAPISAFNSRFLEYVLQNLPLRGTLTSNGVISYFESIDLFFWQLVRQYQAQQPQSLTDLHGLSQLAKQILDLILYGIAMPDSAANHTP